MGDKIFEITYEYDGEVRTFKVWAKTAEQAQAEFERYSLFGKFISISEGKERIRYDELEG